MFRIRTCGEFKMVMRFGFHKSRDISSPVEQQLVCLLKNDSTPWGYLVV